MDNKQEEFRFSLTLNTLIDEYLGLYSQVDEKTKNKEKVYNILLIKLEYISECLAKLISYIHLHTTNDITAGELYKELNIENVANLIYYQREILK
jgi:hypothetical protein